MFLTQVLVTPLDWGLGHATRCIPIINYLLLQKCTVIIAASGNSLVLLKQEFPLLTFIEIKNKPIYYQKLRGSFALAILKQFPKLLYNLYYDYTSVQKIVQKFNIQLIISDNRYACFSKNVYSIFVIHQIFIQLPSAFRCLESIVLKLNNWFINKYSECWIPDVADPEINASGDLSHLQPLPKKYKFIGIISRFKPLKKLNLHYDLAVILSGPEPQRTLFEELIMKQLQHLDLKIVVVKGIASSQKKVSVLPNITIYDSLNSYELNKLIQSSKIVVARAGYSTIMDLLTIGKAAILIPTPQQTEQIYLAKILDQKKIFLTHQQQTLNLSELLKKVNEYTPIFLPSYLENYLQNCLQTKITPINSI